MNRALKFRTLASRITGISVPVFGVQWNPPKAECDVVRNLLVFLEDRRALFNEFPLETQNEVEGSVQKIREKLTEAIAALPENSEAVASFRAMRLACREYLDSLKKQMYNQWLIDLGRLRGVFGYQCVLLAVKFGVDIEPQLASIVPPEFRKKAEVE
jgi:hypothetical protein